MNREEAIDAVDAFCVAKLPGFGERVTVRPEPLGRSASWVFELDGVELGRYAITPMRGHEDRWRRTYHATAYRRMVGKAGRDRQAEQERGQLWGAIMAELDRYVDLAAGKPGTPDASRGRRVVFDREPGESKPKGGATPLEEREDWPERLERLAEIDRRIHEGVPVEAACALSNMKKGTYYRWKKRSSSDRSS